MARFLVIETGLVLVRFLVSSRVITLGFILVGGTFGMQGFGSLHMWFLL